MRGPAWRLFAKNVNTGEWILIGSHYQAESWMNDKINMFERLGVETRTEEYQTEYDDRG